MAKIHCALAVYLTVYAAVLPKKVVPLMFTTCLCRKKRERESRGKSLKRVSKK